MTAVPASPEPTNPSLNIYLPAFSGGVGWLVLGWGWAGECFREHFSYSTVIVQFYCFAEKKTRLDIKACTTASPRVDNYTDIFNHFRKAFKNKK